MTPGAGLLQYGPWDGLHLLNKRLVWCLRNDYTFVALKWAWGEARGRECIRSDTRPTEQRSPRPISAQPEGRHVFWAEALLLAPYRSTAGYARRSRLASAQNPLPRMYSYFRDTTLASWKRRSCIDNSNRPDTLESSKAETLDEAACSPNSQKLEMTSKPKLTSND